MLLDQKTNNVTEEATISEAALMESYLIDMLHRMNDEDRQAYMESEDYYALLENGIITESKGTHVVLNREDDLTRRIKMAVYLQAKQDGDPNYKALKKVIAKKHELNAKLMQKYGSRVKQKAIKAQRDLIKVNPKIFKRRFIAQGT